MRRAIGRPLLAVAYCLRRFCLALAALPFTDEGPQAALAELLADDAGAVGYLLKDRVAGGAELTDALHRVAAGGTAMDPKVIAALLNDNSHHESLRALTGRENDVLARMAEGRSKCRDRHRAAPVRGAVSKYTTSLFSKLGIHTAADADNGACSPSSPISTAGRSRARTDGVVGIRAVREIALGFECLELVPQRGADRRVRPTAEDDPTRCR